MCDTQKYTEPFKSFCVILSSIFLCTFQCYIGHCQTESLPGLSSVEMEEKNKQLNIEWMRLRLKKINLFEIMSDAVIFPFSSIISDELYKRTKIARHSCIYYNLLNYGQEENETHDHFHFDGSEMYKRNTLLSVLVCCCMGASCYHCSWIYEHNKLIAVCERLLSVDILYMYKYLMYALYHNQVITSNCHITNGCGQPWETSIFIQQIKLSVSIHYVTHTREMYTFACMTWHDGTRAFAVHIIFNLRCRLEQLLYRREMTESEPH